MPDDEEHALAVYQALRALGGLPRARVPKAAGLDDAQTGRGLARLAELGLVQENDGTLEPVEPDSALVRTLDTYRSNAAEQARMEALTRSLVTVYRPAANSRVDVEYLTERRRKNRTVHDLDATVRETCDALHPGGMPPMDVLEESLESDLEMVARGVQVRNIYAQSVLHNPRHTRYLERLAESGVRVRLLDHGPADVVIYDRLVVCLPSDPENPGGPMIVVRGSALARIHVATFEDHWLRSEPLGQRPEARSGGADLTPQEVVVVRLMAGGLSDEQIARRVGVHRRTVQRTVAKLMERLGAASRFEAGLRLAQDPEFARLVRREPAVR
jgi:DNA-binding CsgD family transcriptional regulator